VVAIKNFQRMIQSIMKFCFGSIARGSLNFWIGSTTNEPKLIEWERQNRERRQSRPNGRKLIAGSRLATRPGCG
jgi:hypothetical protein